MSTQARQQPVNALLSERLAFVRNKEGGVCRVRILRETDDRYVVGYPDPAMNGRAIQALMKSEWRIVPSKADMYCVYMALATLAGVLISGIYIYANTR